MTLDEQRKHILEHLRKTGLAIMPRSYFAKAGLGFPVEICEQCGCVVDATLMGKHIESHEAVK